MKIKSGLLSFILLANIAAAQGVQPPPVNSFKPDSSLPRVTVPEFVITGRGHTQVEQFSKEITDIDTAYFQSKHLNILAFNLPNDKSLTLQSSEPQSGNLYGRLSFGNYQSTSYLLSGDGPIDGGDVNGSISGNYTSGFSTQTIQRDFSLQTGIVKKIAFDGGVNSNNSVELAYSRGSYYLYGLGEFMQLRTTNRFDIGLNSDLLFDGVPVAGDLTFDRFAVQDYWKDVESSVDLNAKTFFQLPAGVIIVDGGLKIGNHSASSAEYYSTHIAGTDKALFHLNLGADYASTSGNFSYTVGLHYFQYSDDSSSGIGKIYPDLRANYFINEKLTLLAKFSGEIREESITNMLSADRYVDASFPLRDMQAYVDASVGAHWFVSNGLSLTPTINILASRFYPIFFSRPSSAEGDTITQSGNGLSYADNAVVFTTSVSAIYIDDSFTAGLDLNARVDRADSLTAIPNVPDISMTIVGSYSIMPRVQLKGSLQILSDRYADLNLENKLGSVFLLDLHLGYDLNFGQLPIEIFADGKNLLNEKYYIWQNYQEFPLTVSVGVTVKI